jgi:EAL domain-containing protein (putative c-di-GMP-specific phosphodiesterase class I)
LLEDNTHHRYTDLITLTKSILQRYPNSKLDLELTETSLMTNAEHAQHILDKLKQFGIKWNIDDFGTGYSSLAYLKKFPLNTLKIDRYFVHDIEDNPEDAAIVKAIIEMAHQLGLNVVAEGVENKEQLKYLIKAKCNEIQGYLIAKPMEKELVSDWIKNYKFEYFDLLK